MRYLQYIKREVLGDERVARLLVALRWIVIFLSVTLVTVSLMYIGYQLGELSTRVEHLETIEYPTPTKDEAPEPQPTDDESEWFKETLRQYQNGEL